jgi:DNA-binding MarR family transcriptional regulator
VTAAPDPANPAAPADPAGPGSSAPDDETLGEAFWAVARRMRHLTQGLVNSLGITPGQARALTVLRRHGEMRLSDLSHHLHIAPRSATEVVDALEAQALVIRSPDPADRRAVLLTLTSAGADVATQLGAARQTEAETFFARLTEADRTTLAGILRTLRQ